MKDENIRNARRMQAAFVAARTDNLKRLSEATVHFGDPDLRDEYGLTLLMWAARKNSRQALRFLISKGADVNLVDRVRRNALFHAAMFGKLEACTLLIEAGVNLAHRDKWGGSCLRASRSGGTVETYCLVRRAMISQGVVLDEEPSILKLKEFASALVDEIRLGKKENELPSEEQRRLQAFAVYDCFAVPG